MLIRTPVSMYAVTTTLQSYEFLFATYSNKEEAENVAADCNKRDGNKLTYSVIKFNVMELTFREDEE